MNRKFAKSLRQLDIYVNRKVWIAPKITVIFFLFSIALICSRDIGKYFNLNVIQSGALVVQISKDKDISLILTNCGFQDILTLRNEGHFTSKFTLLQTVGITKQLVDSTVKNTSQSLTAIVVPNVAT